LALNGRAGQKSDLSQGLRAERTHRELRLTLAPVGSGGSKEDATVAPEYEFAIPGEIEAPAYGVRLRVEVDQTVSGKPPKTTRLRNWKAGDRVTLRYSSGPRKVKEVLERLRITGTKRTLWPVLEVEGRIVWMRGAELEPESGLRVMATEL